KGVLICRSGFTPNALTLAAAKGIDACNVHDASSQKWALEIRVPILWSQLTPVIVGFGGAHMLAGDSLPGSFEHTVISSDGGSSRINILSTFERAWNDGRLPRGVDQDHHIHDPSRTFEILAWDATGNQVWRPYDLDVTYKVTRKAWLGSFSPDQCVGLLHY